jgi:hypothetical protein
MGWDGRTMGAQGERDGCQNATYPEIERGAGPRCWEAANKNKATINQRNQQKTSSIDGGEMGWDKRTTGAAGGA